MSANSHHESPGDFSAKRKKIIASARKTLPDNQKKTAGELANKVFAGAPIEDLESQSAKSLAHILQAARAAVHDGGTILKLESHDDEQALLTVSMSNRPFILDSILADLAEANCTIHLVVHPLLKMDNGGLRSLVLIVLHGMSANAKKVLKAKIKRTMDQVRVVTDDWQPMLARLGTVVAELRTSPPPIPAEQIAEAVQFIEWLSHDNFTLMGLREYAWKGNKKSGTLEPVKGSALGMLRDPDLTIMTRGNQPVVLTPEIRDFLNSADPLIITKANVRSTVHRRTHLDYIGVKRYDAKGGLAGELRIIGLFTSTAYTKSVMTIPLLRHKAHSVLERFKADPTGHSGKALINILETWPRDEMFQVDAETLARFSGVALQLEERPRVRVLARVDRFDRFVSAIVYVPRERYDSDVRQRIGNRIAELYHGRISAWFPQFLENGMTRVQYILGRDSGKTPSISELELEEEVRSIIRTWQDRFQEVADDDRIVQVSFPTDYQDNFTAEEAYVDARLFSPLETSSQVAVDFYDPMRKTEHENATALKLFHLNTAVPLSIRVPMLENMGFHVIEESTFEVLRGDGETIYIHDMFLDSEFGAGADTQEMDDALTECLEAVWNGLADNDNFNMLVLAASLDWRQVTIFRAFARYLRQIQSGFTVESMAVTLSRYPEVTRSLAELFDVRFNPKTMARDDKAGTIAQSIISALEEIQSSDDDRIIRNFLSLTQATLRTNYYQPRLNLAQGGAKVEIEGAPQPVLALKIDPSAVPIMPQPVPHREIFVSSPRVEGLHLRFGPVARGGLRWSDRAQDYRTEVLGLVKTQQVKNAVIVPVGSKGGFVPKKLPDRSNRDAWFEEGRDSYKIYISSMLSLTDNIVDGRVVAPDKTVRHDGDDPYFVVAADKGTATFSDTANGISQAYDFWLDDAFASGGSAGYDHKKMGITARGAWEAVKRHFREIDRDIQSEPFTAAGVGDMSGDVFGNGMLLSKHTLLIAAFDHRDIFIDPNPDAAKSFKERKRLFKLSRSSWNDYNSKLISKGGGVFSRAAKSITLTKPAADALGAEPGTYTPQDVMSIILRAPIDLLWFGGIGTYVRASHESDADAGDRGNDAIRVTADDVRAKAIGEGANLGFTQQGRIAFNKAGGRSNSDAIDNSAGVNSSDVEVNIKIALASAMKSKKLSRSKRDTLLESMTEEVAELVLRNNYLQTLSISLTERRGMEDLAHQQQMMQQLERRNLLDRDVEDLPDDAQIAEQMQAEQPLTRAEIGVLLAYAKIVALDDLVATDVPDDDYLERELVRYFPEKMRDKYAKEIETHQLRREIIGTVLANSMINRGGATFVSRVQNRTGAKLETVARAYVAVRDAFDMQAINEQIDRLDTKIAGDLQLELYQIIQERVIEQTVWFVRYGDFSRGIGAVVKAYGDAVSKLMPKLESLVPEFLKVRIKTDAERFSDAGVPDNLALTLARLPIAGLIPDIQLASSRTGKPLEKAAEVFFTITEVFRIGRIVQAARNIEADDYYDALALDRALQSLHSGRRDIVTDVLAHKGTADQWLEKRSEAVERTRDQMKDIVEHDHATVSRLTVAANVLADLARG